MCRDGTPIYVGETGSFRERWNARLLEAYQAGVINMTLDKPVQVWFGVLAKPLTREERRTVEAAIIRLLIKGGLGGKLRQGRSFNEIRPGTSVTLVNPLPRGITPAGVAQLKKPNLLDVPANSVFEAEFYELAPAS